LFKSSRSERGEIYAEGFTNFAHREFGGSGGWFGDADRQEKRDDEYRSGK
jgi:hypothetical protein